MKYLHPPLNQQKLLTHKILPETLIAALITFLQEEKQFLITHNRKISARFDLNP